MKVRIDHYPHGDLIIFHHLLETRSFDPRERLYRFIEPLEKCQIPFVLGVSPALINRTSDIHFLRSLKYCEIAMMGFSHGWHDFSANWYAIQDHQSAGGEFAQDDQTTVFEKLSRGVDILSEFKVDTFIAPFNVYNQFVLDALNRLGFKTVMGGAETVKYNMDKLDHGDLALDLCQPPFFNSSKNLLAHVHDAHKMKKTIGLQWIYEASADLDHWRKIAETIRQLNADADVFHGKTKNPESTRRTEAAVGQKILQPVNLPIAIVTETLNYVSGGVRCIVEVLNRLSRRGYQASCYVTNPDLRCEWLDTDFPILPVSEFHKFDGIAISPYSPTAEIVSRSNAAGKFYWVHSYEPKFPELTGRADEWRIMSEASYRYDNLQYFAVSTYVKMILDLIYRRKVLTPLVPGGVDTSLFKPDDKEGGQLKVMFLSREHRFRGGHEIIEALQTVHDNGINVNAYVMGAPVDMGGIPHEYHPPLPQKEFAALLGKMDVFVHASHFEGLPLPPLEAMACGCAVISTNVGASDYLLDGFNAIVVPPGRANRIADAVKLLAHDPDLRRRIQKQGLETVRSSYTWEHTTDRLLEALTEGISLRNSRPAPPRPEAPSGPVRRRRSTAGGRKPCRVSAIVSAYNSEKFIRGCLDDLESQTISDQLEIVVVNSGSQQNEEDIVRAYQERYPNITYLKTGHREPVYQAWNRAIRVAKGKYITNANTDDRHRRDAFEVMANVMDALPEIALVYADVIITEQENETFDQCTPSGSYHWRDFDRQSLLEGRCFIGPQPMWRKSVHDEYGFFDESYITSGDFEFWLRISQSHRFLHLPVQLGLYLNSPQSIEHRNRELQQKENRRLLALYRQAHEDAQIIRRRFGMSASLVEHRPAGNSMGADPDEPMPEKLIQRVQCHRRKEEYDLATTILSRAIKQNPGARILYDLLCDILLDTEQYDEVLTVVKQNRAGKWDRRALELSATALERAGRYAEARNVLDKAFLNGHRSACLLTLKGLVAHRDGDPDAAMACFRQAIHQDAAYGPAYANSGLMHIENGDAARGLILLEKAFLKTPCDLQVLTDYHTAVSASGDCQAAEPHFRKALGQNPDHKKLNYFYIDILIQQQKFQDAMAQIERAIATFGVGDGILGPAVNIRNKIGKSDLNRAPEHQRISLCMIVKDEENNLAGALLSAKGIADEMIVVDTGSGDHTRDIARIFGATVYDFVWNGNFADARNRALSMACGDWIFVLDADEQVSPRDHEAIKRLVGAKDNRMRSFSFATRNYVNDVGVEGWQANDGAYTEEAGTGWYPSTKVRLFPNLPSVRFENAVHEKVDESLERSAIAVLPSEIPIHHFGDLDADRTARKKRAYYQLGKTKLLTEGSQDALVEHAIQAGETGDFENAIALWSKVLAADPGYAKAYFNLGYAYIQLGQYRNARAASLKALEIDPDLKEASLNLSLCELRTGDVEQSIQILERFLQRFPDHPMAMGNLGVAYCTGGQKEKGKDYLNRVARMGFDSREFVARHAAEMRTAGRSDREAALLAAVA
ncbi:hypothetical protein DSCA_06780 [Desulfosarcina alkanivorans]|uniref:Glycosyltransferase 2-like domain-containing protein n=1 Tax=Desulfosarcina alkanivorans TaxID=571177 RepID=A0A5K7YC74_9BACT|nr:glycosyltransferase [Desulfosarcina alkanivorans]BBO66748.1 hypothetical protein DSCA_06780 [Desulfosarcina alkanivorans]